MRRIDAHEVAEMGPTMDVHALDEPGPGGACHAYRVDWRTGSVTIPFQRGPRGETANNGLLEPALLAIIADRLRAFQAGPYPSPETAEALEHVEAALAALHRRVRDRVGRGVMGQSRA